MEKNDAISTAQAVTGTAAAGALAIPVAGPIISGVLGATSGLMGLFKDKNKAPVNAGQRMASALQGQNLSRMSSQTGLSSADVQRVGQLSSDAQAEQLATLSSLPQMSLFDRQRLGETLISEMKKTNNSFVDRISSLDPMADIQRSSAISQASATKFNMDAQIRSTEMAEQQRAELTQAARVKSFNDGLTKTASALTKFWETNKKKKTTEAEAEAETVVGDIIVKDNGAMQIGSGATAGFQDTSTPRQFQTEAEILKGGYNGALDGSGVYIDDAKWDELKGSSLLNI